MLVISKNVGGDRFLVICSFNCAFYKEPIVVPNFDKNIILSLKNWHKATCS